MVDTQCHDGVQDTTKSVRHAGAQILGNRTHDLKWRYAGITAGSTANSGQHGQSAKEEGWMLRMLYVG